MTARDVSPAMVELARQRLGERAQLVVADITEPLPYPDGSFELVVASLVLHYVEDWTAVLAEVHRVLEPTGSFVFSTHHPMHWQVPEDYFSTRRVHDVWEKGSERYEVSFWRRPLTAMCEAIGNAGFAIERLVEPPPLAELAERDPLAFSKLSTRPRFVFFALRPKGAVPEPAVGRSLGGNVSIATITIDCVDADKVASF